MLKSAQLLEAEDEEEAAPGARAAADWTGGNSGSGGWMEVGAATDVGVIRGLPSLGGGAEVAASERRRLSGTSDSEIFSA